MKPQANRNVSMEANLKVEVLDLQHRRVTKAKVEVTDEQSKKKTSAKLNTTSDVFEATLTAPDLYSIRVTLQEHEAQTRKVQVNPGEHEETFVMGKKGMPFYYRGRVKVPFEPLPGLIAVTTIRRLDTRDADELFKSATEFGLQGEEPTLALQHENTWLFKGPADEAAQEQILLGLTKHPLVQRAGPVLTREKDRVLYLTSELIVKFRAHVVREAVPKIVAEYGLEVIRALPAAGNAYLLRWNKPPALTLLKVCESLMHRGDVECTRNPTSQSPWKTSR